MTFPIWLMFAVLVIKYGQYSWRHTMLTHSINQRSVTALEMNNEHQIALH